VFKTLNFLKFVAMAGPARRGRGGWTQVRLAALDATTARSALTAAWRNVAPKTLRAVFDAAARPARR
jgi:hypothetical protein